MGAVQGAVRLFLECEETAGHPAVRLEEGHITTWLESIRTVRARYWSIGRARLG